MQPCRTPTSVHPHETNVPPRLRDLAAVVPLPPLPEIPPDIRTRDLCQIFRHSGWMPERKRVLAAMCAAGLSSGRARRFASCGSNAWVMYDEHDHEHLTIQGNYCNDRFCTPCARERSRKITAAVTNRLKTKKPRFITLTLKADPTPLPQRVQKLWDSFRKLRGSEAWSRGVSGGIAFLEITWSKTWESWHTHLHVLAEGRYIPHPLLKAAWQKASGGSTVVDIRATGDVRNAAKYVTKYAAKPLDTTVASRPDLLQAAIGGLASRRLYTTFGDWRGVPLVKQDEKIGWITLCRLETLVERAKAGHREALVTLAALHREDPSRLFDCLPPVIAETDPRPPPAEEPYPYLFPMARCW